MKKLFLLFGLLAIGFAVSAGNFEISTKEKSPPVVVVVEVDHDFINVPRETGFGEGGLLKYEGLLPAPIYLDRMCVQNDTYLHRSEKWIRDRNLYLKALPTNFEFNKSFKTQFLS